MTTQRIEVNVPTRDGHTATLSYALSDTQGWDVRAQIDDHVLTRHCYNWRGVERFYEWLRMAPVAALRRSSP